MLLGFTEEGILHGLLGFERIGDVVDIDRLAVHPSAFRRGIAKALLDDLHRRQADASRFDVSTATGNRPALALYERMGYRIRRTSTIAGLDIVYLSRTAT